MWMVHMCIEPTINTLFYLYIWCILSWHIHSHFFIFHSWNNNQFVSMQKCSCPLMCNSPVTHIIIEKINWFQTNCKGIYILLYMCIEGRERVLSQKKKKSSFVFCLFDLRHIPPIYRPVFFRRTLFSQYQFNISCFFLL